MFAAFHEKMVVFLNKGMDSGDCIAARPLKEFRGKVRGSEAFHLRRIPEPEPGVLAGLKRGILSGIDFRTFGPAPHLALRLEPTRLPIRVSGFLVRWLPQLGSPRSCLSCHFIVLHRER